MTQNRVGYAILATLMAIVVILTLAVAVKAGTVLTPAIDAQSRIIVRGGVVRLGPTPYLHDDAHHASIGISAVTVENGNLVIWTDAAEGEQLVAAIAEEDEAISKLGVQAGISASASKLVVVLYLDGKRVRATDAMFGSTANLWVHVTYLRGDL